MRICYLLCFGLLCQLMSVSLSAEPRLTAEPVAAEPVIVEQDYFRLVPLSEGVVQQAPEVIYKDTKGRLWLVYPDFVLLLKGEQVTRLEVPAFVGKPQVQSEYPKVVEFDDTIVISWRDRLISFDPLIQRLVPFRPDDFAISNAKDAIIDLDVDPLGKLWVTTLWEVLTLTSPSAAFVPVDINIQQLILDDFALMSLQPNAFREVWITSMGLGVLSVNNLLLIPSQKN